jgi:hypothetical protein
VRGLVGRDRVHLEGQRPFQTRDHPQGTRGQRRGRGLAAGRQQLDHDRQEQEGHRVGRHLSVLTTTTTISTTKDHRMGRHLTVLRQQQHHQQ